MRDTNGSGRPYERPGQGWSRCCPGVGTLVALAIAILVTAVTAEHFWQHQAVLQRDGFASRDNGWLWKLIHLAGYPGPLPAYVVGSTTGSWPASAMAYVTGMFLVYGVIGMAVDLVCWLVQTFNLQPSNSDPTGG